MVLDYYTNTEYTQLDDEQFQKACALVKKRADDLESDDDSTVALAASPISESKVKEEEKEVIEIADSPVPSANTSQTASQKRKDRGDEKEKDSAQKKKKVSIVHPTSNRKTPAKKSSVAKQVTPATAFKSVINCESIAKKISPHHGPYTIMKNHSPYTIMKHSDAGKLLKDKFGVTYNEVEGKYYLPSQDKAVATTLAGLREDLCEHGLPEAIKPLSEDEMIDIARWVRYTHVNGIVDGQTITPADFGKPIDSFMQGNPFRKESLLCKFGCKYSGGKYSVPTIGGGKKVFERQCDVDCHFAQFGIKCILDDISVDELSHC